MTTVTVQVDNEQNAALLEKMLKALSFVETVKIDPSFIVDEPKGTYQKLKKAIDKAEGHNLLTHIDDPSKWQRDIRDDW